MHKLILLIFIFVSGFLSAQETDFPKKEQKLLALSKTFLQDSLRANRFAAEQTFRTELEQTLRSPGSFSYPFKELKAVSVLYPQDSTFRIFTWQLYMDKNEYRYGGIIQKNQPENKLFLLTDQSDQLATYDIEYEVLGAEDWYGSLYYNIHSFESGEGTRYLLFGFDGYEFFRKRKLVEVLYFDQNDQPVFGAPAFAKTAEGYEATTKNRLYLEYAAEVAARLNYDHQLNMIISDHLISMRSPHRGVGNVSIPDGSYEGYQLQEGTWEYVDKIFHEILEKPPAPSPVLHTRNSRDLFGKATKKKN